MIWLGRIFFGNFGNVLLEIHVEIIALFFINCVQADTYEEDNAIFQGLKDNSILHV